MKTKKEIKEEKNTVVGFLVVIKQQSELEKWSHKSFRIDFNFVIKHSERKKERKKERREKREKREK